MARAIGFAPAAQVKKIKEIKEKKKRARYSITGPVRVDTEQEILIFKLSMIRAGLPILDGLIMVQG